jgi:hypothetical protein
MKAKKHLLSFQYIVVAVILLTKGWDKIQHHHSAIGWTILLFGVIVLGYFVYIKTARQSNHWLELIMHFFESVALFLTTYVYFQEGKSFLPYVTLAAAIGFLVATVLHIKNHRTLTSRH